MINKIASYMQKHRMVQENDHILAGVSGGADSVCLFLVLKELRHTMGFTMSVVHIEHGIRGEESLADLDFVKKLCARHEIPAVCKRYSVAEIARMRGLSIEEAGRDVRYAAFEEEAGRLEKEIDLKGRVLIAVAHHADDNAETVLFHLCRGSGIDGLAGIRPVRDRIIRPLLCVSRSEIEAFLKEAGEAYKTDATNEDTVYSRNHIRKHAMPKLLEVNRGAVRHINCLAEEAAELSAYLRLETDGILKERIEKNIEKSIKKSLETSAEKSRETDMKSSAEKNTETDMESGIETGIETSMKKSGNGELKFSLQDFGQYPLALKKRLMLGLAGEACGSRKDISREHICAVLSLAEGPTGKKISLPYGITAEKSYEYLLFYPAERRKESAGETLAEIPKTWMPDGSMADASGDILIPAGRFADRTGLLRGMLRYRIFELAGHGAGENGEENLHQKEVRPAKKPDGAQKDIKIPKNLYTKWFDYDKIENRLYLRNRKPGDYFTLDHQGHKQKLKDYWMNEKVPRQQRERALLLADGSHILWAVGYRISGYYKVTEQTKYVLEVRYMEEQYE